MKRKIISCILATGCVISLCSCGTDNAAPKTEAGIEESSQQPEQTEQSETVSARDVYILPQHLDNPNLVIVWDMSEEEWENFKANDSNAFNLVWSTKEAFEQMYGGTVTVYGVGWGEMINKTTEMVEKGEVCDLVQANDQNFPRYANDGIVQDVSKYVNLDDDFWYDNVTTAFTFGGTPYAMGADANPVVISYNKTLFEQKGVKTPSEYFEEGNWNWDTFKEVGTKMAEDTDGDGENDIYGFGWWDSFYVQVLNADGTTALVYDDEGKVYSNYASSEAKETFEFLQDGYCKSKYIQQPGVDFVEAFKSGKLAMTCEYGFGAKSVYECDYEVGWAPLPTGPSGEAYSSGGSIAGFAIPVTSANPEGAAAFARMAYEMQLDYNRRQRVEQNGLQEVELMNELSKHIYFAPIGVNNYGDAQWIVANGIVTGQPIPEFTKEADDKLREGNK
ncbi:ABC-type sugar transport system, periplasmic component [Butyrivibrio fibrisolvens 16/4]|nr:ABC-type sugar transport system, periplasmic component [Butyrivibrio fibrisolvens 16/4]